MPKTQPEPRKLAFEGAAMQIAQTGALALYRVGGSREDIGNGLLRVAVGLLLTKFSKEKVAQALYAVADKIATGDFNAKTPN